MNELKQTALNLCKNAPEENKCLFGTKEYERDPYYYESGMKLRYFYDKTAVDKDGNLVVPKEQSISRVCTNQYQYTITLPANLRLICTF